MKATFLVKLKTAWYYGFSRFVIIHSSDDRHTLQHNPNFAVQLQHSTKTESAAVKLDYVCKIFRLRILFPFYFIYFNKASALNLLTRSIGENGLISGTLQLLQSSTINIV